MSKTRIALIVAMMFAVPAGVAALEESASGPDAEMSESALDILASAAEPVTGAEPSEAAAEPAETLAQPELAVEPEPAVQGAANIQRAAASDAFPRNDEVGATLLPSQLAYLERVERERSHLVARGDAFPTSGPMNQPLPAQVAYLDRVEQSRIAAAQAQQVAQVEVSPVAAGQSIHAAGVEELVAAHASGSR